MLHLHPAKRLIFFAKLGRKRDKEEGENIFPKNFSKVLPETKELITFAPALRDKR
jgi:hypothetical protein